MMNVPPLANWTRYLDFYNPPPPPRTWQECMAIWVPSIQLPLAAIPYLDGGILILAVCIYTTLLDNRKAWRPFRMALSIPAIWLFVSQGWTANFHREHNRSGYLSLGTIGSYGIMRIWDTCWIRELDDDRPRYIGIKYDPHKKKDDMERPEDRGNINDIDVKPKSELSAGGSLILPQTIKARLAYVFDLVTTVRGISWFSDRAFDFTPSSLLEVSSSTNTVSRPQFIIDRLKETVPQYLLMDLLDTFTKALRWEPNDLYPVTSLPILLQIPASISVAVTTVLYLFMPFTFMSCLFVAMGASTKSWPQMFNSPLQATSLRDFWSVRWHSIFLRCFSRIYVGVMWFFPTRNKQIRRIARLFTTFFLSCFLHLCILYTLPPLPNPPGVPTPKAYPFFDEGTLKFFLAQPILLFLESQVVFPLTERLRPGSRAKCRRAYAWACMLWTGRWWADSWVGKGLYDDTERPIVFSPVRGLLRGDWII